MKNIPPPPHLPPVTPHPPNFRIQEEEIPPSLVDWCPEVVDPSPPLPPNYSQSPIPQVIRSTTEDGVAEVLEEIICEVVEVVEKKQAAVLVHEVLVDLIDMIAETRNRDKRREVEECED